MDERRGADVLLPKSDPPLAEPRVEWHPVPAYCYTPANRTAIRAIVWHDLEGYAEGAVDWWKRTRAASAHYIVRRDGSIWVTVDPKNIAWHAGTDAATGRTPFWRTHNINPDSVGIELEGFYDQPYDEPQLQACEWLACELTTNYGIQAKHVLNAVPGHHLHSEISNQRSDPGEYFPLGRMIAACAGV